MIAEAEQGGDAGESSSRPRAEVCPISDGDLADVGRFLGTQFPPDTPAHEWGEAWLRTVNLPGSAAPNHGFMLRAAGRIVGAYPAIYSTRMIDGRRERFCNLAVWCVSPDFRAQSLGMLKAILAQEGFHFTDLSPIERVQKLNAALGFQYLDTATALAPNLPWPVSRRVVISADPAVIETTVTGEIKQFFEDHARCRWAKHLILVHEGEWCYLQWRKERRKKLPLFISIRYASHPEVLRRAFRSLASYFLFRHGALFTLGELRITGGRVYPSLMLRRPTRRMFKSKTLSPDRIDYLYSEITSAP